LSALGYHAANGRRYVNIQLAARPVGAELRIILQNSPARIVADQIDKSDRWRVGFRGTNLSTKDLLVESSGKRVVVTLPGALAASGVAVATPHGDRLPAQGFASLQPEPSAHVNEIDIVLVLVFLLAAWRGFRRGFLAFLPILAGLAATLILTRFLSPPLGSALQGWLSGVSRLGNAVAFGIVFTVLALCAYALAQRLSTRTMARFEARLPLHAGTTADRSLGALVGSARAFLLVAATIVLAVDLAGSTWFGGAVGASELGRALVAAWRHLYPGL
jgi:uncharacterized membrane protein required for colicin V production